MNAIPEVVPNAAPLLEVSGVRKSFSRDEADPILVLDDVNLSLAEGEIVGLLGRSGSGKSTLLRIIAGLSSASGGEVRFAGQRVVQPARGISMVFQSFALFPWLTVEENVVLGLEAQGLPKDEIQRRTAAAIDLIGLGGFEGAYPRELSGGMRQRVGVARALVVHPRILLMDEPFSALDVLTAETLRTDFLELWGEGQLAIGSVVLVTHNIEEAVQMCDRICVFGSNPGRILTTLAVDLPRPRDRLDPAFRELVERIYVEMTARAPKSVAARVEHFPGTGIGNLLPVVSTTVLAGLLETVAAAPFLGRADLPVIARTLQLEIDDLFPAAELLQMLRFVDLEGGDIQVNEAGMAYAGAGAEERKALFARHLLTYIPLATHIRRVLDERDSHRAPKTRFRDELEDHMSPEAAEQTLQSIISLGRYAEAFVYDDEGQAFALEG